EKRAGTRAHRAPTPRCRARPVGPARRARRPTSWDGAPRAHRVRLIAAHCAPASGRFTRDASMPVHRLALRLARDERAHRRSHLDVLAFAVRTFDGERKTDLFASLQ